MQHNKNKNKIGPALLLLVISPSIQSVFAENSPDDPTRLPEVVVEGEAEQETALSSVKGYVAKRSVSATKSDTPLLETPQSISVITNDQMEAQNVTSMAEALRYTPGVNSETFGYEPRFTWIWMRGFDVTTAGLYRDGLKLINPGFAIGYSLEPFGAERIEVPRGPSSVLFGQASPGGLVNYVSKRPTFSPLHSIKFEAGNFNRYQGEVDFSDVIDDDGTMAYRFTGLFRGSGTQVNFVPDDRIYIAPSFTWKPSDQTTFTFLSHYHNDSSRASQRYPFEGTLKTNPNGSVDSSLFNGEPNVDFYEREEFAVGYQLEHRFNDLLSFRQNARFYNNQVDDRTVYPTFLLDDKRTVNRAIFDSFGKVHGFNLDNQLQFDFQTGFAKHQALFGLDYQHVAANSVQAFGTAPDLDIFNPHYGQSVTIPPIFKNDDSRQDQIGLYLQDQIKLGEHWRVLLSGRYDRAESKTKNNLFGTRTVQDDNALTGRAGLVYVDDSGVAPYFSYARSFLPALGTDALGNAFQPETGEQYEFGLKYEPKGQNIFLSAAYFDLTRQNYLTSNPITFQQLQRGEAHSQGVELEGKAGFENGLDLTLSYAFTDGEITDSAAATEIGEPLEYTPDHKVTAWADYTQQIGLMKEWGLGGGIRYIGDSFGSQFAGKNATRVPGVVLFDAAVHYDWKPFRFAVNLQNALDENYIATAFSSGSQEWATYGARRLVMGSVQYNF